MATLKDQEIISAQEIDYLDQTRCTSVTGLQVGGIRLDTSRVTLLPLSDFLVRMLTAGGNPGRGVGGIPSPFELNQLGFNS